MTHDIESEECAPSLGARLRRMFRRTRQSHALEHATVHVLTRRHPGLQVMGRSTPGGFYIYGNVKTVDLASAVSEALARLQAGESHLAVHPRCGTNLAVGALLSGLAAMLVLGRRRRSLLEEVPEIFLALTAALFLSQPVGLSVQEHVTTTPDVHDVRIAGIARQRLGQQAAHRVTLEDC